MKKFRVKNLKELEQAGFKYMPVLDCWFVDENPFGVKPDQIGTVIEGEKEENYLNKTVKTTTGRRIDQLAVEEIVD